MGQLPTGSAYWAARGDDDELAELALQGAGDAGMSAGRAAPPLSEMTQTNQLLIDVVDGLQGVTARLDALMGAPGRAEAYPRPQTALARVRRRVAMAQRTSLLEEVHTAQERWTDG